MGWVGSREEPSWVSLGASWGLKDVRNVGVSLGAALEYQRAAALTLGLGLW